MRAASRARADVWHLSMMRRASRELPSRYSVSASPITDSVCPFTSGLPSRVFVCPSNCGSPSFTLTTAVSPSRTSSAVRFGSDSASSLLRRAWPFSTRVSAERKPVMWLPPSIVLIVLAKAKTCSLKPSLYCSAISIAVPAISRLMSKGSGCSTPRSRFR